MQHQRVGCSRRVGPGWVGFAAGLELRQSEDSGLTAPRCRVKPFSGDAMSSACPAELGGGPALERGCCSALTVRRRLGASRAGF